MPDLEAIRERNEEEKASLASWPHRYCQDTFYACPMHPEYMGCESPTPENCDCDYEDRRQRADDIDALLAEVERLRAIACRHGRPMLAPCEFCERDEPVDTTAGVDVDRPAY